MFNLASLKQMWSNAWPVISLLLVCSMVSAAIILERWVELKKADFDRDTLLNKIRKLLLDGRREQALAHCESVNKPVGKVLTAVFEASRQSRSDREVLERLGFRLVRAETSGLNRYVTALGTIGSTAPFIGLFGTVLGIIHAFKAISENAGGGPGVVANGIAEALITTALGLFVAIPAVIAYNLYTRKIERITEDMELCSEEVADLLTVR